MSQESGWKEIIDDIRRAQRCQRDAPPSDWGLLVLGLILFVGGLVALIVSLVRLWA
jgi:uncharacterized membrane protein YgdD (TMEM256/DUF423 family)